MKKAALTSNGSGSIVPVNLILSAVSFQWGNAAKAPSPLELNLASGTTKQNAADLRVT